MKAIILAFTLVLLALPAQAAECTCGRTFCAQNGLMTYQGRYAVVQVTSYDGRRACWCLYDTLAEARKALASATKR